ncbi:hypothetical protein N9R54_03695 [Pelobium sp.]|nr:hypothetical protein [Pelobium sp.]MDA9555317.1 hypothetical protein [Pelobium sp.]
MRREHLYTAITSGLAIYAGCLLGALTKAPPLMLFFTFLVPGVAFGIVLTMTNSLENSSRNILIFFLSILIYFLAFYLADIANRIELLNPSLKIVLASVIGALLLSISYDLLINKELQFPRTFLNPIVLGILSSLISAYSTYKLDSIKYDQKGLEFLVQMGIYSIYPIWQILFVLNKDLPNRKGST